MPRDPTFSGRDIIRFYQRNLEPDEQAEVVAFFAVVLGGGANYMARQIFRGILSVLEKMGRKVAKQDTEMELFIQDLVEQEQARRPRFKTGGGF